ncbi:sensor histidine kinase [Chitinophaga arvensicola]|uniref:Histidine kinase n=1 Tax=Chitinophaga arvensicola TaxID=29529 RepID=A0A1I0PPC4_9BACT|nr:histidine kinase [Chitinophaga arvensicola]SEW16257.1 Histidine kinase [Chitinophaga arvensicola]
MRNLIAIAMLAIISCGQPSHQRRDSTDSLSTAIQQRIIPFMLNSQNDSARRYLDSIYPVVMILGDNTVASTWWRLRGATFMYTDQQQDSTRIYIEKAMGLVDKEDTINKYVMWAKRDLAMHYHIMKEYDKAIRYNMDVYAQKDKLDTNLRIAIIGQMAGLFDETGDGKTALKYWMEGYQTTHHPRIIYIFATNISNYYEGLNKSDSVKKYRGIALANQTDLNDRFKAIGIFNQGEVLRQQQQYGKALPLYHQAIDILRSDTAYLDGSYFYAVAVTHQQMGNLSRSNIYLDTAISLSYNKQEFQGLADAYALYGGNRAAQMDFTRSHAFMDSALKYHKTQDSVSFREKANELENKYQVRIKDERISSLDREKRLSEQVSRQRLTSLILVIVGSLFGIILLYLLARKRQSDLQSEQQSLYLRLLRTQIDPHFLFNALSVLKAYMRENTKAADYLAKLAKLLRISLVNANANYVRLNDEVEALHSYIGMRKIHEGDRFDYEIEVYDGYESDVVMIPPMLIQPIVENAIVHGISKLADRRGHISVKIEKENAVLRCTIQDNGNGLKAPLIVDDGQPHAATITADRLRVLGKQTGKKAVLQVDHNEIGVDRGVRVTMIIPYKNEDATVDRHRRRRWL